MPLVVLPVLLVVLLVTALVLELGVRSSRALQGAHDAAIRAARQEALNLTALDSRDLTGSLARVIAGATGAFRDDLVTRESTLAQVIPANKVVADGTVVEAGLVRGDADTATVIVAIDATIRNVANPQGRINAYRMRLDLERHGSRWLTSALQFVG